MKPEWIIFVVVLALIGYRGRLSHDAHVAEMKRLDNIAREITNLAEETIRLKVNSACSGYTLEPEGKAK